MSERLAGMMSGKSQDQFEMRVLAADGRVVRFHSVMSASTREDGSTLLGGFWFELGKTADVAGPP